MPSDSQFVVDANDANFEEVAIRGSTQQPVVVDFWAEWCGPCRALGPLLESLAEEFAGAFLLVKVDTESAPEASQRFNVRSIPAVVGIADGKIVAEFVGAQPEASVREFLAKLIPPPAEDQPTDKTDAPDGPAAQLQLGADLASRNQYEDALEVYLEVVKASPDFEDEAARRAMLELFDVLGSDHDVTRAFRAKLARLLYR